MPAQKPAATGFLSNCPPHALSSSPRPHRKHGQRACVRYFLPSTEECPCGQPFKCTYIFPADLNAADYGIENRKQHDRSSKPNELDLRNEFCSAGNHVAAFERYVVELILIVLEHIYRGKYYHRHGRKVMIYEHAAGNQHPGQHGRCHAGKDEEYLRIEPEPVAQEHDEQRQRACKADPPYCGVAES